MKKLYFCFKVSVLKYCQLAINEVFFKYIVLSIVSNLYYCLIMDNYNYLPQKKKC